MGRTHRTAEFSRSGAEYLLHPTWGDGDPPCPAVRGDGIARTPLLCMEKERQAAFHAVPPEKVSRDATTQGLA